LIGQASFKLIAGHRAVDFVNTVGGGEQATEELRTYLDLVAWAQQAGLVKHEPAAQLRVAAEADPARAAAVLDTARKLRAHLDAVLRAELIHQAPPKDHLDVIRDTYLTALAHARLTPGPPHYRWEWTTPPHDAQSVLWLIAHEVVDLLNTTDLKRLKQCSACRWLYLDATKNQTRRWCTPEECGVRTRMRRYRAARRPS
jgi:predicted RNA-binding Zn ribbon-like protein